MSTKRITRRAFISVTDKRLLQQLSSLPEFGYQIISTGGTGKVLKELGIPYTEVSEYTGMEEMMNGRLKTLHPKILGGLLADRNNPEDLRDAEKHEIPLADLLVCNLYEFKKKPSVSEIDIGGPTLLRAAAKNHASVTVVVDPDDYVRLIEQMRTGSLLEDDPLQSLTSGAFRLEMAHKVFAITAQYDTMIAAWFGQQCLTAGSATN